jgi:hypothetical protein
MCIDPWYQPSDEAFSWFYLALFDAGFGWVRSRSLQRLWGPGPLAG